MEEKGCVSCFHVAKQGDPVFLFCTLRRAIVEYNSSCFEFRAVMEEFCCRDCRYFEKLLGSDYVEEWYCAFHNGILINDKRCEAFEKKYYKKHPEKE